MTTTVYINLHPEYDYATAVISGYLDLRDYVKHVDWLTWDTLKRGTRQLMISGTIGDHEKAKAEHLERARVFAQRVSSRGATVLVRNERNEDWLSFSAPLLTQEALLDVECALCQMPDEERWATARVERYRQRVAEQGAIWQDVLDRALEELNDVQADIQQKARSKRQALMNLWSEPLVAALPAQLA